MWIDTLPTADDGRILLKCTPYGSVITAHKDTLIAMFGSCSTYEEAIETDARNGYGYREYLDTWHQQSLLP